MTGKLRLLDRQETYEWDTDDPTSVEQTKERFEDVIRNGYGFAVKDGTPTPTRTFDETAEQIIVTPQWSGG